MTDAKRMIVFLSAIALVVLPQSGACGKEAQ